MGPAKRRRAPPPPPARLLGLGLLLTALGLAACSSGPGPAPSGAGAVTAQYVEDSRRQEATTAQASPEPFPPPPAATPEPIVATPPPDTPAPQAPGPKTAAPEPSARRESAPVPESLPAPPPATVAFRIHHPAERAALAQRLRDAGYDPAAASDAADAPLVVADTPLPGASPLLLDAWAAVVHQRHDVLDVSFDALRLAFRGVLGAWSALGGGDQPIQLLIPSASGGILAAALDLPRLAPTARELPLEILVEAVRTTPGALALIPVGALSPGLLPLVVDGHDPLRDPAADVAVVSMEVATVDAAFSSPCEPTFVLTAPAGAADALAGAGVDVVTTAGNHSADCYGGCGGIFAILDTLDRLDALGIAHAGTGADRTQASAPALLERDGVRLAVLSYEGQASYYAATDDIPGVAFLNLDTLAQDVRAARLQADHVIVALSAGAEYATTTTRLQDDAVRVASQAGASLVLGNHPHAIQPLVELDGALAIFALGNFVFDQDWSVETTQSVLLEVGFSADRLLGYRVRPVVIRRNYQPEAVDPAGPEGRQILSRLWAASDAWLAR